MKNFLLYLFVFLICACNNATKVENKENDKTIDSNVAKTNEAPEADEGEVQL